ncbi:MAG: hypothetical protein IPJ68_02810 [Candidatus Moraniibacteriota bacterium]|nr:MAG: hypothetical protein IPJ68_02810 [Candidatus Moranbacteria bacterium]
MIETQPVDLDDPTDTVENDLPTTVTCPVCGFSMTRAERDANMNGDCCSAECALASAIPLHQGLLFTDGSAPFSVSEHGDAALQWSAQMGQDDAVDNWRQQGDTDYSGWQLSLFA